MVVNAKDFGAKGDGVTDDAAALQAALDGGDGEVHVDAGTYLLGTTLLMGSGDRLISTPETIYRMADGSAKNARSFLVSNRNPGNANQDIVLDGGVWDGNCEHNPRGKDGDLWGFTGTAINFSNVKGLQVRNLTVRNPEAFSIRVGEVEEFVIEDIVFDHPISRPNQDGVHVGGYSFKGQLRRLKAITPRTTNDDMVALNADDDVERVLNLGMRRGPIRDITVEGVEAPDVYTFVRLLSVTEPVEQIRISGIRGGCRVHVLNINNWRFPPGVGAIRDVRIRDCDVKKTASAKWSDSQMDIALGVDDFEVSDYRVTPGGHPEAYVLTVRNDTRERITLSGLSEAQVAATLGKSSGLKVVEQTAERLVVDLDKGSRLVVPDGSIGRLRIERR